MEFEPFFGWYFLLFIHLFIFFTIIKDTSKFSRSIVVLRSWDKAALIEINTCTITFVSVYQHQNMKPMVPSYDPSQETLFTFLATPDFRRLYNEILEKTKKGFFKKIYTHGTRPFP